MNNILLLIAEIAFVAITIVFVGLLCKAIKTGIEKTTWDKQKKFTVFRRFITTLIVWLVFVTVWSGSGRMADFSIFPFNFMPVIVIPLAIILFVTIFSKNLLDIIAEINPAFIVRLQSFRIFVEVTLWMLFIAKAIPEQMTFEGRNFDILAGITGPVIGYFITRNKISKTGLIVWNFAGLGLLINIVTVAVLSTPSPVRMFFNEPANTIVATFPSVLLPAFLVPLAYTLHFLSLKQALSKKNYLHPKPMEKEAALS